MRAPSSCVSPPLVNLSSSSVEFSWQCSQSWGHRCCLQTFSYHTVLLYKSAFHEYSSIQHSEQQSCYRSSSMVYPLLMINICTEWANVGAAVHRRNVAMCADPNKKCLCCLNSNLIKLKMKCANLRYFDVLDLFDSQSFGDAQQEKLQQISNLKYRWKNEQFRWFGPIQINTAL